MEINHVPVSLRHGRLDQFEYGHSGGVYWLNLGGSPYISLFLPDNPLQRKAVLLALRSSLNESVDKALKADDLAALDAEVAEPELAGSKA